MGRWITATLFLFGIIIAVQLATAAGGGDDCQGKCKNGECRADESKPNKFYCDCDNGYCGRLCQHQGLKTCGATGDCCQHGECVDGQGNEDAHCECPPDWTGTYCETPVDIDKK